MITIQTLQEYGADTATGLARCMNMEAFYLRLVNTELQDTNFEKLNTAIATGDAHAAFDCAHALKGALGNLALTPMFDPACTLTEMLRHADSTEGTEEPLKELMDAYERLKALA